MTERELPIVVSEKAKKISGTSVEIDVKRYYKSHKDGTRTFRMRLVKPGNVFYWRYVHTGTPNIHYVLTYIAFIVPRCTVVVSKSLQFAKFRT